MKLEDVKVGNEKYFGIMEENIPIKNEIPIEFNIIKKNKKSCRVRILRERNINTDRMDTLWYDHEGGYFYLNRMVCNIMRNSYRPHKVRIVSQKEFEIFTIKKDIEEHKTRKRTIIEEILDLETKLNIKNNKRKALKDGIRKLEAKLKEMEVE